MLTPAAASRVLPSCAPCSSTARCTMHPRHMKPQTARTWLWLTQEIAERGTKEVASALFRWFTAIRELVELWRRASKYYGTCRPFCSWPRGLCTRDVRSRQVKMYIRYETESTSDKGVCTVAVPSLDSLGLVSSVEKARSPRTQCGSLGLNYLTLFSLPRSIH